ncbi:hypothetical protein [Chamaesiphon sp. OTE_75_metabat_556]|uniref:hypothetical protein n=1 Tax=Chamaesiphon sp. OTE_75_metabat_556 TaxID=2964692 RepID=UPI00286BB7A9|nr:hypothetical protein [Chamaesiphon sp. OTE_75_metabat_556]
MLTHNSIESYFISAFTAWLQLQIPVRYVADLNWRAEINAMGESIVILFCGF